MFRATFTVIVLRGRKEGRKGTDDDKKDNKVSKRHMGERKEEDKSKR
jgi:hypothetical protein